MFKTSCYFFTVIFSMFLKEGTFLCQRFDTLEVLERFYLKKTSIPLTVEDAINAGWSFIISEETYNIEIYRFQTVNSFFIFFYKGELVGVGPTKIFSDGLKIRWQRAYNERMFINSLLIDRKKVYYGMIYFVNPYSLTKNLEVRCDKNVIFINTHGDEWHQVPYLESDIKFLLKNLQKQGCQDKRGFYYFYNMKKRTRCRNINSFFALYNTLGQLSGFGVMIFGDSHIENEHHPLPIYTTLPIPYMRDMAPQSRCVKKRGIYGISLLHIMIKVDTDSFRCPKKTETVT